MLETKKNRVPLYGIIIGVVTAFLQHGIYLLANEVAHWIGNTPFLPKINAIDDLIPIVPIFIIPYIWSYVFWAGAPMAASLCKKEHFLDYLAAYLIACLFGAVILAVAPTYMDRIAEGIYDGQGPLFDLMRFWYSMDGGYIAYNLFPSFHCINSTVSYLAVRKREEVPKWFRVYSFITMILIFFSTVLVKQHYICDVFGGIAIAIGAFAFSKKVHAGRMFLGPINFFKKLFGKGETA